MLPLSCRPPSPVFKDRGSRVGWEEGSLGQVEETAVPGALFSFLFSQHLSLPPAIKWASPYDSQGAE